MYERALFVSFDNTMAREEFEEDVEEEDELEVKPKAKKVPPTLFRSCSTAHGKALTNATCQRDL
jgi:hypothetical protein